MKKIELTKENFCDFFLGEVCPSLDFEVKEIKERDEVSHYSNNNYLFRLRCRTSKGDKVFYMKQARGYNKRAFEKHGKIIKVDKKRICGEYNLMRFLEKLWGKEYVPKIHYFNDCHCVLVMEDVSGDAPLLVDEFNKNKIHPDLGLLFGRLFGKLHGYTCGTKKEIAGSIRWRNEIISFFGMRHFAKGISKFVSKQEINKFYRNVLKVKHSIIWGDPVYRNIFIKPNKKVAMVDFDHVVTYDPSLDTGMFLAHWIWMGLKGKSLMANSKSFIEDFWKGYGREFKKNIPPHRIRGGKEGLQKEIDKIKERSLRWSGIYLVSRTDGKSGSYFKKWPKREKRIREEGIKLFLEK